VSSVKRLVFWGHSGVPVFLGLTKTSSTFAACLLPYLVIASPS